MSTRATRGRPTITKRADGKYQCDVDFGVDPESGVRRRRHIKRDSRKEVALIVAELGGGRAAGLVDPDRVTVRQWFELWSAAGAQHRKPKTTRGYQSHFRCHIAPELGDIQLRKLTTKDIETFLLRLVDRKGRGLSASTASSVRRTLRSCLGEAGHQQPGGSPPERLVRQLPGHAVTGDALATAASAPTVILDNPARQHRTVGLEALPGHHQPELIEARERRQVRASEGSVSHVEVFRMGSVRTSILRGTSTPTRPPTRRPALHPHL